MAFLREGIENVHVVVLPDAVTPDGKSVAFSRMALVTWKSCWQDMLHQVYVNGCCAATTADPRQCRLVVPIPTSPETPVHIEVVGIDPADCNEDLSDQLEDERSLGNRIRLTLLRSQSLPANARVNIYSDNGTGEIDDTTPVNGTPIPLWPCWQDKAGFGLDADCMTWTSRVMPLGSYRFAVTVIDDRGAESAMTEAPAASLLPASCPVSRLDAVAFNEETNQLTLNVSDSIQ